MKWRNVVMFAALAAACRVGDLVGTRGGPRLEFTVQPSRADTSTPITPPVQVTVRDATGRPDTSFHDSVALDLGSNPGGAALVVTPRARVEGGVATFANVRINKPGDGYVLRATAPGRPATMSAAFAVDSIPTPDEPDPPIATQLAFTVQPSHTQTGGTITPAVRVAARTADGTLVTSFAGTISLAIGSNPGGGSLSGTTSSVASNGIATFNGLGIDRAGNGYTLTAAASALDGATSTAFNVTSTPPPPPPPATQLAFIAQPSNEEAGDVISPAIGVAARDAAGNLVPGFAGTITLVLGANPGGGTLLGTTARNATNGVATFDDLQINQPGSGYTLRATAGGLTAATSVAFNITAPPPQARRLAFTVQPSNAEVGSSITPPIQVAARDDAGNVVTSFGGTITLAIGSNPGGGTLSGTTSSIAANGVATFSGLRIDRAGNGYTLTAAATGLSGATSTSFSITAPPPPPPAATQLAFTVQPSNTVAGEDITPDIKVAARDAAGNVVTSFTGPITISIGTNPGGGSLSGSTTKNAMNGVATFDNLHIDKPGSGYTLRATASGLTAATSAAFNITADPSAEPVGLRFSRQPANSRVNQPISPSVRVQVLDAAGNVLTSFNGPVTIDLAPNLLNATVFGTVTVNAVSGVANFADLRVNQVGVDFRLRAAFAGQAPIVTSNPFAVGL